MSYCKKKQKQCIMLNVWIKVQYIKDKNQYGWPPVSHEYMCNETMGLKKSGLAESDKLNYAINSSYFSLCIVSKFIWQFYSIASYSSFKITVKAYSHLGLHKPNVKPLLTSVICKWGGSGAGGGSNTHHLNSRSELCVQRNNPEVH